MATVTKTLKYGLKGGVMAAVLNLIIFEIALRGFGLDFTVVMRGTQSVVTELQVILASFLPALVAALIYFGLVKKTARPDRNFIVIAVIVLLLSLYNPYNAATSVGAIWVLSLMHVVAAFEITKSLTHDAGKALHKMTNVRPPGSGEPDD